MTTSERGLLIGSPPLPQLADSVGTPCYLYDSARIATQVALVRDILPPKFKLHYAVKANPYPPLLRYIAGLVDGFDIASGGELAASTAAGMPGPKISFAGPGKRRGELEQAIIAGALIHVESSTELETLVALAGDLGRMPRVALRINPAFEVKSAGMRMGGGSRPFGIDEEAVPALLAGWARFGNTLSFEGFHIYAGSQMLDGTTIAAVMRAAFDLAQRLAPFAPAPIRSLNLGGGFGIPYFSHESPLDLVPISQALRDIAASAASAMPDADLIIELGRYLVGPAGVYVSRVIDKKVSRGHTYLIVDGGLHHHLAASGNFGQVIRRNFPVALVPQSSPKVGAGGTAHSVITSVVGPLCTPLDLLADRVELPEAAIGDLFVVFQSGAYGASASPQGFLSHPPVTEALI